MPFLGEALHTVTDQSTGLIAEPACVLLLMTLSHTFKPFAESESEPD